MYAIAFDMLISKLVTNYGEPYNNAYYEIKQVLGEYDFDNLQGSVYLTSNTSLANLYNAIQALSSIEWFRNSVRDIRAFKVEDWSDFTETVKHPETNQKRTRSGKHNT